MFDVSVYWPSPEILELRIFSTIKKTIWPMLFIASVGMSPTSSAAGIILELANTGPVVTTSDVVNLDVVVDFSGQPTIGGVFDIEFDDDALQFISLTSFVVGDPDLGREPDLVPGALELWGFYDFSNGVGGPFVLGTISFTVLATMGVDTHVTPGMSNVLDNSFVSFPDFVTQIDVEFVGVELIRVPAPAAVWLLISGLSLFAGLHRPARLPVKGVGIVAPPTLVINSFRWKRSYLYRA